MLTTTNTNNSKKVQPSAVFGLTALAIAGSGLYATTAEASSVHTVNKGEYLGLIAQKYGVTVQQLRQWNSLQTDVLQIGQQLSIASTSSTNDTYVVTATALNVRSGAGTNNSIIGKLTKGQSVSVLSHANGWYSINYNGKTGFVSADFLSKQNNSSANNTQEDSSVSGTYVVTATALNVRSGAGTNSSIIGRLTKGQSVSVLSHANGWYSIQYNGKTGFVSADFLSKQSGASGSTAQGDSSVSGTYIVTASALNVRSGAGTNNNVIGSLKKGQSVSVNSLSNGWYSINYNGKTGFVSADFLSKQNNSANNDSSSNTIDGQTIAAFAKQFLGIPYVWGGASPSGFDCSGFIAYVFNQNGTSLSRTNVAGYWNNSSLQTTSNPQAGDLIFFQNTYTSGPSHMGIMVSGTEFIHASSSNGVTITSTSNTYWNQHFLGYKSVR